MEGPLLFLPHFLLLSVTHGKEYPALANLGQPGVQALLSHSPKDGCVMNTIPAINQIPQHHILFLGGSDLHPSQAQLEASDLLTC